MKWILVVLCAYFLGAIPFGYIVGRCSGIDIRQYGSGNVGFTNVWRTLGIGRAAVVLAGDLGKGWLAACIGFQLMGEMGALVGGLAAILGHTFSCFINFKGGKGVATSAGVLLYFSPLTVLVCLVVLTTLCLTTRYMSLGSICAAWVAPLVLYVTHAPTPYTLGIGAAALYVIYLHIPNIHRLMKGTENKIGQKGKPKGTEAKESEPKAEEDDSHE